MAPDAFYLAAAARFVRVEDSGMEALSQRGTEIRERSEPRVNKQANEKRSYEERTQACKH